MDKVVLVGCLLLVAFGGLLGVGLNATEEVSKQVRNAFELLSFSGSIITACVAFIALTSWQAQFRHSEKNKAVKSFQSALDDGAAGVEYVSALFEKFAKLHRDGGAVEIVELFDMIQKPQKKWLNHCANVDRYWQELLICFGSSEIAKFKSTPQDIEFQVQVEVKNLLQLGLVVGEPDLLGMHEVLERCSIYLRRETRGLYAVSNELRKKLVG